VNSQNAPQFLAGARRAYLRSLRRLHRAPRTLAAHRRILDALQAFLDGRDVSDVSDIRGRHLAAFGKRLVPRGARRQMGIVRAFLAYAHLRDSRRRREDSATPDVVSGFPTGAVTGGHFLWVPARDQDIPLVKPLGGKRSPMSDNRQLLPLQEIHKTRIHMPYSQLLRLARLGRLPVRKFGKAYYGDPAEVVAALLPPAQETVTKPGRKS